MTQFDVQRERRRVREGAPELLGQLDLERRAAERCSLT